MLIQVTNWRLLIGRKCLKAKSEPLFLSVGLTRASFHTSGKTPDCNDWLIMTVNKGTSSSKHSLTTFVGTGSREHNYVGALSTSFLTESLLRSSKLEKNPDEDESWEQFGDGAKVL